MTNSKPACGIISSRRRCDDVCTFCRAAEVAGFTSRVGALQAAFGLRDSGRLAEYEQRLIERELDWIKMHLKSPVCLREIGNDRAISWFHPRAQRPTEKVRIITSLLKEYGQYVRMLKTDDPGTVIYEDG